MNRTIKKVIRASAGTGKTYRLSLEFVNLLLSPIESFEDILVITFTKKATSEIRNAVFAHLDNLIAGNEEGLKVRNNLLTIFNREVSSEDIVYLKSVQENMLINKHKLRISTIDSFITTIFKGIIAPYMGIVDFEINNDINKRYLPVIYDKLISSPAFNNDFTKLFRTAKIKTVEGYDAAVNSLLNNRWLIEMMTPDTVDPPNQEPINQEPINQEPINQEPINQEPINQEPRTNQSRTKNQEPRTQECLKRYGDEMRELIKLFIAYLHQSNKIDSPIDKLFKKEYYSSFKFASTDSLDWLEKFSNSLTNEEFLYNYWIVLIKEPVFWSGKNCYNTKPDTDTKIFMLEKVRQTAEHLSEYIFLKYLLPEQDDIIKLTATITGIYDELKMRDQIFTYSDITYYTFKHLYDPELSMIDEATGTVENRFYEYLSTHTRFLLIDEYQDTSTIQHKILLPIIREVISGAGAKDYGGVIIVGDEKQSIYGWRSGERELLLKIPEILDGAQCSSLNTSYRSTPFIMNFVNKLFKGISQNLPTAFPEETKTFTENLDGELWSYDEIIPHKKDNEGFLGLYFHNKSSSSDTETKDPHRQFVERVIKPAYDEGKVDLAKSVVLARTNNDLISLAAVLEEHGIPCYQESSISIVHHNAVKPVIYLLQYISSSNILYLLKFLRSDICLMDAPKLKKVIEANVRTEQSLPSCCTTDGSDVSRITARRSVVRTEHHASLSDDVDDPFYLKVKQIVSQSSRLDLLSLVTLIIEEFGIIKIFPEEYQIKNINLFIEVTAKYLNGQDSASVTGSLTPAVKTVQSFLNYLEENENSDDLRQVSIDQLNAIQLLSIHKSKGLQFESVFCYYKEAGGGNRGLDIDYYYIYDDYLTGFRNSCLTLNYKNAIKHRDLYKMKKYRELLEELNIIYVALTRAEKNIFLYIPYQNKNGLQAKIDEFDKNLNSHPEKINLNSFFIKEIFEYISLELDSTSDTDWSAPFISITFGTVEPTNQEPRTKNQSTKNQEPLNQEPLNQDTPFPYKKYISFNNDHLLAEREEEDHIDYKSVYVKNKLPLFGEVVHYYLSFVKYGTSEELQQARNRTVSFFGNILPVETINRLIEKTGKFIRDNQTIFSSSWDKVFTEKTVFDKHGREYRIDRLMIDKASRKVMIIDYKTGSVSDKDQLHRYKEIVENFSYTIEQGYTVNTQYLDVPL